MSPHPDEIRHRVPDEARVLRLRIESASAGVTETYWLPNPFAMNGQMTRRGTVRLDKDEPLCVVFRLTARAWVKRGAPAA